MTTPEGFTKLDERTVYTITADGQVLLMQAILGNYETIKLSPTAFNLLSKELGNECN